MLDGQVCQVCCHGRVGGVPFATLDGQVCCHGKVGGVPFAMLDGQVCCHGKVDNVPFAMLDGEVHCHGKVSSPQQQGLCPTPHLLQQILWLHAQFSLVQDGICVLGKAHMRSTLSVRSFPSIAFEATRCPV